MIIKKYWNKYLDWESEEITFDKGWAMLILVIFTLSVFR